METQIISRTRRPTEAAKRGVLTLAELPIGSTAFVVGYTDGSRARRRFIDMGLVPGTPVTRLRAAPLGDPSEYAVFGARIAIRDCDAATVLIEGIVQ